jgi:hypothetical protein
MNTTTALTTIGAQAPLTIKPTAMKNKYTFETLGIGKLYTLGIARRVKVKRYGVQRTPNTTYQLKVHIGKLSFYLAKKGKKAKKLGGRMDIIAYGGSELEGIKEKLIGIGIIGLLILISVADSLN